MKEKDYHLHDPTWCLGCGIYGVFSSLKVTALSLHLKPEEIVIVTGIGCHGRLNNYFRSYGFHSLHGRALPVATGAKLANVQLSVITVSGDGDAYSIGLNHFIHAVRRNVDLTYIVINNMIYALTQGQTSPTSQMGVISISAPYGSKELPLDGPRLAFASGGTFIARGFSGAPKQLSYLFEQGIRHKGFSLVDVLSPCVTHNKINTYDWYRKNTYDIGQKQGYDPGNKDMAGQVLKGEKKMALGLLYKEKRPSYEKLLLLDEKPLLRSRLTIDRKDRERILKRFE
jgi:2-oxoglutarate ferredoxin oxidoreductase subunit beta